MAKPDLDEGWIRYAHSLDAALACADWSKGARIVLRLVFEQVFVGGKRAATLTPSEVARLTGMPKQYAHRSIAELVDGGALAESPDGSLRFVKDFEKWTRRVGPRPSGGGADARPKAPRLSKAECVFAGGAKDRALAHAPHERQKPQGRKPRAVTSRDDEASPHGMTHQKEASPIQMTERHLTGLRPVTSRDDETSPHGMTPDPRAYKVSARREEGKKEEEVCSLRSHTQEGPLCVTGADDVSRPAAPQCVNAPEDVRRVSELAEQLFPCMHFDSHVLSYSTLWPMAWMERALIDARSWRNRPRTFKPIVNLLQTWTEAGGPPAIEAARPSPAGMPAPESPAAARQRSVIEGIKKVDWHAIEEEINARR